MTRLDGESRNRTTRTRRAKWTLPSAGMLALVAGCHDGSEDRQWRIWQRPSLGYRTAAEVFCARLSSASTDGSCARRYAALRRAASGGAISKATKPSGLPPVHRTNHPTESCHPNRQKMALTDEVLNLRS